MPTPKSENLAQPFLRFQSLAKRLLAVPKAEADRQKPLATKKQSRPKHSPVRG
jgi:hypothetical protein